MNPTDELRRMLTDAGVEWTDCSYKDTCTAWSSNGITWYGLWRDGSIELLAHHLTPEQAIAATVGRGTCRKVYLVEVSDELLEGWYPMTVYLHRESAEDCAEALRKKDGGIWQFARVSELKVMDE